VLARFSFFADCGLVRSELMLHNARAAKHTGGLWDLGDAAAWHFSEFALELISTANFEQAELQIDRDMELKVPKSGGTLVQHSSGGRNWRSHSRHS
jgi:hypothetical protein